MYMALAKSEIQGLKTVIHKNHSMSNEPQMNTKKVRGRTQFVATVVYSMRENNVLLMANSVENVASPFSEMVQKQKRSI